MTHSGGVPRLGGEQRQRDPEIWGALLGRDDRRRKRAARTIKALEQERWYARQLLEALPGLQRWQKPGAGDALSLLGDLRFSAPHYLSEMIHIPPGTAVLGSDVYDEERPMHRVDLTGFSLAQHPVTNQAYAAFISATDHSPPSHWSRMLRDDAPDTATLNQPVTWVSAHDAQEYCAWLSAETGYRYRLPTEAEWVLAARGDGETRRYPWGEEFSERNINAWSENSLRRLCAVGLFAQGCGPYEHDDLAGNVWEWCSSLYWPYPYDVNDGRENPASDERRVMHGGSWRSKHISVRCAARQGEPATDCFEVVGFRVARDAKSIDGV